MFEELAKWEHQHGALSRTLNDNENIPSSGVARIFPGGDLKISEFSSENIRIFSSSIQLQLNGLHFPKHITPTHYYTWAMDMHLCNTYGTSHTIVNVGQSLFYHQGFEGTFKFVIMAERSQARIFLLLFVLLLFEIEALKSIY